MVNLSIFQCCEPVLIENLHWLPTYRDTKIEPIRKECDMIDPNTDQQEYGTGPSGKKKL